MPTINTELQHRLCSGLEVMEIQLHNQQIEQLLQLVQLLVQWNKAYNLTSVREPMQMIGYHLLDSLSLMPFIATGPILDIGTGAGFPGLPLAIAYPNFNFTLLDSNGKKIRFVRQVILELGLNNVTPVQARIEAYIATTKFAIVVARALASLAQLIAWANNLLQPQGTLFACKGNNVHAELASFEAKLVKLHQVTVPYIQGDRIIVEFSQLL